MTHTYHITGMTCGSCVATVKSQLLKLQDIISAEISLENKQATIEMSKHISTNALQEAISPDKKYIITEDSTAMKEDEAKNWFATYKPLLLIFAFITFISFVSAQMNNEIHWMHFMNTFMAGFFLTFSFFKYLHLKGFAESYSMYDIIAKQVKQWGYIYAFIELFLGIAYTIDFNPFITNISTLIIMSISIIGVLQSVLNKQKIKCACLGAVFNLPMSTVTIIEDALMIAMSAVMLMII